MSPTTGGARSTVWLTVRSRSAHPVGHFGAALRPRWPMDAGKRDRLLELPSWLLSSDSRRHSITWNGARLWSCRCVAAGDGAPKPCLARGQLLGCVQRPSWCPIFGPARGTRRPVGSCLPPLVRRAWGVSRPRGRAADFPLFRSGQAVRKIPGRVRGACALVLRRSHVAVIVGVSAGVTAVGPVGASIDNLSLVATAAASPN
jgi:hypothetical protein